jgi:hypothetical protein
MLLLMDTIVEFDRMDKTCRNPTIAETTIVGDDPAVINMMKGDKKKGKGRGKGKGKGNVTVTFLVTTPRPSTKQCKFCNKVGHVE